MSASPQLLRRIKNNLSDSGETYPLAHSAGDRGSLVFNGTGLPPKQSNWETTAVRGPTNRSADSGVGSHGDLTRDERRPQRKSRHVYEDVERKSQPPMRHNYEAVDVEARVAAVPESRTSTWVTAHTELNWGRSNRETSGSMWAPQNRQRLPQRQESFERERELTGAYHPPSNARPYSQRSGRNSNTLPTPASPVRRVSYMSAIGAEGTSDRYPPSTSYTSSRYSQQPRNFDSLQRPASTTASSSRRPRRGSESGGSFDQVERFEETKAMLLRNAPTKVSPVHRTRSYGGSMRVSTTGAEGLTRTGSSGRPVGHVKQSLL